MKPSPPLMLFRPALVNAGFLVLMFVLAGFRQAAEGRDSRVKRLLSLLQNTVLPLPASHVILQFVVGMPSSDTILRLIGNALAITFISASQPAAF